MTPGFDRAAAQQRVEASLRRQKRIGRVVFFVVSLFLFILFNLIAWSILGGAGYSLAQGFTVRVGSTVTQTGEPVAAAMIMMMVGWGTTLMFQFISLMLDTRAGEAQMRDRAVARELGQAILEGSLDPAALSEEKAKRAMRLTDDGELQPVDEADDAGAAAQRQQNDAR